MVLVEQTVLPLICTKQALFACISTCLATLTVRPGSGKVPTEINATDGLVSYVFYSCYASIYLIFLTLLFKGILYLSTMISSHGGSARKISSQMHLKVLISELDMYRLRCRYCTILLSTISLLRRWDRHT